MSEISEEEIKDILTIVGRLYARLCNINDTLDTSTKELLDKSLIKARQKKTLSSISLLFQISQGKLDEGSLYSPKELNKGIAENLIQVSRTDTNDMTSLLVDQANEHEKFISSKEFRELLKLFEEFGLLEHISGKRAIKRFKSSKRTPRIL
jgi:hypothetical protein